MSSGVDTIRDFDASEDQIDLSELIQDYNPWTDAIENFVYTDKTEDGLEIGTITNVSCGVKITDPLAVLENIQEINLHDVIIAA